MSSADVIVDTSGLLAYFDASEPDHAAVMDVLEARAGLLVISPYVLAELDYLVATRHGLEAELMVLDELAGGAWELARIGLDELRRARAIIARYHDQAIGVADASNVVLAERHGTQTVVTLDRRHFEMLRSSSGDAFTVLPRPA